ncbi:hypothetical protein CXB49_12990 [Chromobacterium sp. ATCC 53434]|uniref:hypothetical protein n=1 Tax=Chromobacterium sp. (strain ATCC 53434 / SC 14030) TaxID=2059672 RepID=UPI000C779C20|nr:hypothetical protein [Chromobacterium sp. ATCC 53434]AUH51664.1 hypothetical protein CXB49_12990 [Chromobacterium sp. ATCC 53434]
MSWLLMLKKLSWPSGIGLAMLAVWWLQHMQATQDALQKENTALGQQVRQYRDQLEKQQAQFAKLSQTLSRNEAAKRIAEGESHAIEKKLRSLQTMDHCARQPVPAAIISLQRDAIRKGAAD